MAATLTKKQAAEAVAAACDEREIMQANLLDLDGSFGRRLLAGATLTGITRQRWESAAGDLAALWDLYEAYSAVIDRAAETLARRPGQKGLAEITALLNGPSVEIDRGPAPLARRNLVDTGREQMTLTTARARMSAAFAWVTGVVSAAEQAWNDMAGKLDSAAADLSGVDVLGDQDLAFERAEVQADLDWNPRPAEHRSARRPGQPRSGGSTAGTRRCGSGTIRRSCTDAGRRQAADRRSHRGRGCSTCRARRRRRGVPARRREDHRRAAGPRRPHGPVRPNRRS